eukprot:390819_1
MAHCVWGNLDLSPFLALSTHNVNCTGSHGWKYFYVPCKNELQCTDPNGAMVVQGHDNGCVKDMALWDHGIIQPTHAVNQNDEDEWIFYYPNGENDPGDHGCNVTRATTITFICDKDSTKLYEPLIDGETGDCWQEPTENGICWYQMQIHTQHACVSSLGLEDNVLSGGSIFLIIFFVCMLLYCVIGYIFNGIKNSEWNKISSLPQYSFWITLHKYVVAGCVVTYELLRNKCSRK